LVVTSVPKPSSRAAGRRPAGRIEAAARAAFAIVSETLSQWSAERAPRMAAALAFYTVFSLAPLLIIVTAIAGVAFGQEAVEGRLVREIGGLIGSEGAKAVESFVANARPSESGVLATLFGIALLLFGASGVFGELQDSLNTVWNVKPKTSAGWLDWIRRRFISFTMVIGVGFLLLVSLVLSAALAALAEFVARYLQDPVILLRWTEVAFSFVVITVLFAILYRMVPDAEIHWGDVWPGAIVTSLLFAAGKAALGIYLGRSAFSSTYGAAASIVVILLWVYYSAQIFLFGAELTQVYTTRRRAVAPMAGAKRWSGPAKPGVRAQLDSPPRAS
jgi:membrane protein